MPAGRLTPGVLMVVLIGATVANCMDTDMHTDEGPLQCPEESNVKQEITHCSKHKLKYKLTVDGDNGDRVVINHSVEHFPGPPKASGVSKGKSKRMWNRIRKRPRIAKPVPLKGKRLKKLKPVNL